MERDGSIYFEERRKSGEVRGGERGPSTLRIGERAETGKGEVDREGGAKNVQPARAPFRF